MKHIHTGKKGEEMATQWLLKNGYSILCRNWRCGRYEIDIVAKRNEIFHCCEVKTRRGTRYGYPEQSIGRKKMDNMLQAAKLFEAVQTGQVIVQVNIISVKIEPRRVRYFFIENAGMNYER